MSSVIDKVALVLRLTGEHEPCTLQELTVLSGIKKPALYLLLKQLVQNGLLAKEEKTRRYSLGTGVFDLAARRNAELAAVHFSRHIAEELGSEFGEAVTIARLSGGCYHRIAEVESRYSVKVGAVDGRENRLYRSATGRVLLAFAPEAEFRKILALAGMPTPSEWPRMRSPEQLERELRRIREENFAERRTSDGEAVFLASAGFDRNGSAIAVGVNFPLFRYEREESGRIRARLARAAEQLTALLSGENRR